jgi:hypothetical protein
MISLVACVKTEYVPLVRPCITEPPPPKPVIKSTPCGLSLCYDGRDAELLAQWLMDIWDWSQLQYTSCKE